MTKRVLVVEDQEDLRGILRDLLTGSGYEMLEAADGQAGVDKAEAEKPDLILMDIQMPVMDGYEATQLLKADPALRSVPVVALTAYAMPHERERALAAGCIGQIEKPINTQTFIEQLRQFLGRDAPGSDDSGA